MEREEWQELLLRLNRQMVAIMEHQMAIFIRLDRMEAQLERLVATEDAPTAS
jgi:hypothetical protein